MTTNAVAPRPHWLAMSSIRVSRSSVSTLPAQRCFNTCANTSQATNRVPMDWPALLVSGFCPIGTCGRNTSACSRLATMIAPTNTTPIQACHSPGATAASSSLCGTLYSASTLNQVAATNRTVPIQPSGRSRSRYSPVKNNARPMPAASSHRTSRLRAENAAIDVISTRPNVR